MFRHLLVLVLGLALGQSFALGQARPWIYRSNVLPGSSPVVCNAAGGIVVFDKIAMRTIDHGFTLDTVRDLDQDICAFVDFPGAISFAVTYSSASRTVWSYFSQGGNSWSKIDSMMNVDRPTSIATSQTEWFMATENGSTIYRVGETSTTIKGPSSEPIRQLVLVGSMLVANVNGQSIATSTDFGMTWKTLPAEGIGPMHVLDGNAYVASTQGVKKLDVDAGTLVPVGVWAVASPGAPLTLDIDSYLGRLYCLALDGAYQLFQLDPGTTSWVPVGQPLPCRAAAASPSIMTIESGWAVAAINITEGQKDTSGVYAYDLNDFSSVHEGATRDTYPSRIIDRSTTAIELGVENPTALLIDQSGRTVMQCPHLGDGRYQLSASTLAAGVYTIVTQDALSRTVQRLLVP
ncbi:MAG: hypothetical protein RL594_58 [Bacteroidota bacterium]|jgi:hypothetical protein